MEISFFFKHIYIDGTTEGHILRCYNAFSSMNECDYQFSKKRKECDYHHVHTI